ncbi:hypothetical protein IA69_27945 [Massilia sp. JS1662]|nr:hypothetical protein IA69_27945 [Massilia sp. JS1662]
MNKCSVSEDLQCAASPSVDCGSFGRRIKLELAREWRECAKFDGHAGRETQAFCPRFKPQMKHSIVGRLQLFDVFVHRSAVEYVRITVRLC